MYKTEPPVKQCHPSAECLPALLLSGLDLRIGAGDNESAEIAEV